MEMTSLHEQLPWLAAATRAVQERVPGIPPGDAETIALTAVHAAHDPMKAEMLADLADILADLGETSAAAVLDDACAALRTASG